jgi:hypothetical protein
MTEIRSAILMLIAGILLGGPSRGSETASFQSDPILSQSVHSEKSPVILRHSPLPARRATLSAFTPWKTRIKSVLAETYQRVNDESDFGPAISPGQLLASATFELESHPVSIRRPLRC